MHSQLPPEIWVEILRWATTADTVYDLITHSYRPFQSADHSGSFNSIIATKRSLVLVCREWNQWATRFLYEDLAIPHSAPSLKVVLDQGRLGALVRRVVLPYSSTVTPDHRCIASVDDLLLCTNMETLVRPRPTTPDYLCFHFPAQSISLLSLRRLDWWYNSEAERSGGINSLNAVLRSAPNLRYLSAGGVTGFGHVRTDTAPLSLPELHTLRLHRNSVIFLRQLVDSWSLPSLSRIALDYPLMDAWMDILWESLGERLRTVELGKHVRFLLKDHITPCLQLCRGLTELNYFIFFAAVPSIEIIHTSISTIGLHASANDLLADEGRPCGHIQWHFDILTNKSVFPVLRQILLYGDWKCILADPQLAPMWRSLHLGHIAIQIRDTT